MIGMALALLLAHAAHAEESEARHGIAVGERLMAAIKGKAQFQDTDFAKPLNDGDKAALRPFAKCRVRYIDYTATAHPKERNVFVRNFNDVVIGLGCKGVPSDTPVGISLHLKDGKVTKVETHNADLMRVE